MKEEFVFSYSFVCTFLLKNSVYYRIYYIYTARCRIVTGRIFAVTVTRATAIAYCRRTAILKTAIPYASENVVAGIAGAITVNTLALTGLLTSATLTAGAGLYQLAAGRGREATAKCKIKNILYSKGAGAKAKRRHNDKKHERYPLA